VKKVECPVTDEAILPRFLPLKYFYVLSCVTCAELNPVDQCVQAFDLRQDIIDFDGVCDTFNFLLLEVNETLEQLSALGFGLLSYCVVLLVDQFVLIDVRGYAEVKDWRLLAFFTAVVGRSLARR